MHVVDVAAGVEALFPVFRYEVTTFSLSSLSLARAFRTILEDAKPTVDGGSSGSNPRAVRKILCLLCSFAGSGCYLSHPPGDTSLDSGTRDSGTRDSGSGDAGDGDAFVRDASLPRDAGVDSPPRSDVGPDIAPFPDVGPDVMSCVLPVEAFPAPDVCRPDTASCIDACVRDQLCIVDCLNGDPTCRACAVRNALACFNETRCERLYPAVSCCVVENCALASVDEILNACTLFACMSEVQAYANCAIADARLRCREAVGECGIPPTLLGLD